MEEEKNYTPRDDELTRPPTPRDDSGRHSEHRDGPAEEDILSRDGVRAAVEGFEEGEHSLGSENEDIPPSRRRSHDSPPPHEAPPSPDEDMAMPPPIPETISSEFDPKRIFVGRLVKGMSAHKLQDVVERYFSSFGVVERIILPVDAQTGLSKGFSFITFTEPAAVNLVLSCPHVIDEVEVDCKPAFPRNSTKSLQDLADVPGTLFKTRKVFVAGLPSFVSDSELAGHFTRYGQVISGRVIRDKRTGHSRGFGFVEFTTEAAVDKTMSNFSSHYVGGRWVMCKRASMSPPKEKGTHVTSMLEPAVRSTLLRALSCSLTLPRRHEMCAPGPSPYSPRSSGGPPNSGPMRYHHDDSPPMHWSNRRRNSSPDDAAYRRSYSSRSHEHTPCPCCHDRRPGKPRWEGNSPPERPSRFDGPFSGRESEYHSRRPRHDSPVQTRRRPPMPPPNGSSRSQAGPYENSSHPPRRPPRALSPSGPNPDQHRSRLSPSLTMKDEM